MEEKKYQVFVSSTYDDLIKARKKIIETVLSLYHFPVGMEMFSADDAEQWEIIRETIDASDYYVIIIGHKYGSISGTGISYTEMEYDYAKSLDIPVLAFIRDRNTSTQPNEREIDYTKTEKLDKFIEKAKANKMCDFWESIDDLATKVAIALPKIMRRTPRVGWVRGDNSNSKEVSEELAGLSQENRKLRALVHEYESQLQDDKPILKLTMIENDVLLNFSHYEKKQGYIEKFQKTDTPSELLPYMTDEMINKYNNKIPSNHDVDEYNERVFNFTNYSCNSITFHPVLVNEGRRLASDIHIYIEFPDFITTINRSNEDRYIIEPQMKIPESPIEQARMNSLLPPGLSAITGVFSGMRDYENLLNGTMLDSKLLRVRSVAPNFSANANNWVRCEENIVTLRAKKLLQSLKLEFDPVIVIPTGTGSGLIKFKVICEELVEPIYFTKSITIN